MKKSAVVFTSLLLPLDFLMLLLAGLSAYYLRTSAWISQMRPVLFETNLTFEKYIAIVFFVSLFLLVIFALSGLYRMKPMRRLVFDFSKIIIGVSAGIMSLVFYTFIRQEWFDSRFLILAGWLMSIMFVIFGRFFFGLAQKYLMAKYHVGLQKVLIIGDDELSRGIAENIKTLPSLGYRVMGRMVEPDIEAIREREKEIDGIILADPNWSRDVVLRLARFCENEHLVFKFVPNLFQVLTQNSVIENLEGIPLIELKRNKLDGWWRIVKRIFDLIFSFFFLIVFSPVYLLVALMVRLDSPGPIIYKDYRYGYRRKKFIFYKFRSIRSNLCDGEFGTNEGNEMLKKLESDSQLNLRQGQPLHKIKNDPRITQVGKFIRKYSLDELPQFFNVLRGDMSVVGYRPHMSKEVERYSEEQNKMFCAKPGVTGLAQVSGRSDLDFNEEVRLDLFYIENWSFVLDLIIILKTPFVLLFRKYKAAQ